MTIEPNSDHTSSTNELNHHNRPPSTGKLNRPAKTVGAQQLAWTGNIHPNERPNSASGQLYPAKHPTGQSQAGLVTARVQAGNLMHHASPNEGKQSRADKSLAAPLGRKTPKGSCASIPGSCERGGSDWPARVGERNRYRTPDTNKAAT